MIRLVHAPVLEALILLHIADERLQGVQQELVVVTVVRQVSPEASREGSPHAKLLCLDEGLEHDSDRRVHVIVPHLITEMHPRMGLRHSHDGLDVTHGDWHASGCHALLPTKVRSREGR
eukprot:scaffold8278_cov258-Pinguiococcus_pyrenoidosus.AAC.3